MTFTVSWAGVRELGAAIERRVTAMGEATRLGSLQAGHVVEAAMKVRAGEGGRHAAGTPTPASPGGGPAVITGTLRRSIKVGPAVPVGPFGFEVKVGPTAIYGRRIELEYDYPYAEPGFADVVEVLPSIFAQAWGRAW